MVATKQKPKKSSFRGLSFSPRSGDSIKIFPINTNDLKLWTKKASKRHKNWVKANKFSAEEGSILILPDEKGGVFEVLWGILGSTLPEDHFEYAKLAQGLPEGKYHFGKTFSKNTSFQVALGWSLAHYNFDTYKTKPKQKLCVLDAPKNLDKNRLKAILGAITLTRNLINIPTNDLGPLELSNFALGLAKAHKAKSKVIIGDKLLKAGFPTVHAVGRASVNAPRLIDFSWGGKTAPKVTLVGKGVCFDSGGLGIKPSGGMRWMKKDMGGAAHALGLASAIMELKLPIRLRVIIPAVENSISANAFRPGDIIKSRKGLHVEVGHTDAEGRLILCDALALADEDKPDLLIDFATLTGAARVALGPDLPALFTNNDDCAAKLLKAGELTHDPMWRLPLWQPYKEDIKSSIADLNNIGDGGGAGAITAALFLEHFVEHAKIWVHLDLFGWNNKAVAGKPKGGEAQTIRAVLSYIENRYC